MTLNYKKILPYFILVTVLLNIGLNIYLPEFSRYAVAYCFEIIAITSFWAFDKWILKEIDIIHEIFMEKNIAASIFIFAIVVLIVAPFWAS